MADPVGELFDPKAEYWQWDRQRPHRVQAAVIVFLTMRLKDSIPADVLRRWHRERIDFLMRCGIASDGDWKLARTGLSPKMRIAFDKQFHQNREMTLDKCCGSCELRHPEAAQIVSESLQKFHRTRYYLGDFVVMPNHVHCLVAFADEKTAKRQPGGWMRFTAREINQRFARNGELWFPEPFDHLVRNEDQLQYLRKYIRENPKKANLPGDEFLYRRSLGHF
ncbi:transposase [Novipirellula sp. SH528]|uniref:transposase n=1 Tax=Novipirellula sp. SH528 TaxID=3454466 RepID=UPI003FA05430